MDGVSRHSCKIVLDRYPTCTCGSHTWPCRVEKAELVLAAQEKKDRRIARAVADELERRERGR